MTTKEAAKRVLHLMENEGGIFHEREVVEDLIEAVRQEERERACEIVDEWDGELDGDYDLTDLTRRIRREEPQERQLSSECEGIYLRFD